MHTVLRAYAQLRDEGVIQMRQGRGAWISDTAGTDVLRLNELVVQLMAEARKLGVTASEVMRLVERA
jgi:GntR family transcriptional regulator